jgi:hypothetical protein
MALGASEMEDSSGGRVFGLLEHFSHRYTLADDGEEQLSFHPNALTQARWGPRR